MIYINDISEGIKSVIRLFADDTKIFGPVGCDNESEVIQSDISNACVRSWSNKWLLPFNIDICVNLHTGFNNTETDYYMEIGDTNVFKVDCDSRKRSRSCI